MKIDIHRCNNIEEGSIEIREDTLNLKFAINGTGKTTIAKAILGSIAYRQGDKNALSALIPFKYRQDSTNGPEIAGADAIQTAKIFDDRYINDFVFQPDELLKGSFDIFIRGDAYQKGLQEINARVEEMQKALAEDKDIDDLIVDFRDISSSFGKPTKSGIHGASGLAKAFKDGNKVTNVPAELEAYKSYIQHPQNYKWVRWQLDGRNYYEISSDCPFCTSDIQQKRDTIKKVGEVYEPKSIENLNKIVSTFQRLNKYFADGTKAKIEEFVTNVSGYTNEQAEFLIEVKEQIDRLNEKFVNAQRLGFSSLKEVDKVIDGLNAHRIDVTLYVHLCSESTKQKAEIVNSAIAKLLEQAGHLQGMIKKQKLLIESLVKEHSAGINAFLKNAGYSYEVTLLDDGSDQHKLKLLHRDAGEVTDAKAHLSYGERNAFALVLFMYDVLKLNPDLVVLDDPISSFDKNKKYAIIEMLFRKKESLRERTVLLLTHDLEPIVDMVFHHTDRFKKPFATFVENRDGILSEKEITRADIRTFLEVIEENLAAADIHLINKLVHLRRRLDLTGNQGLAYQVISNLLHKRSDPEVIKNGQDRRRMTEVELEEGSDEIRQYVGDFDYQEVLKLILDEGSMVSFYRNATNNYDKLHLYRIIFEGKEDLIGSDVVQKFINETFHIENDYVYQLNPRAFQAVPHYVIVQCDKYVDALTPS